MFLVTDNLLFCAASNNGKTLEKASDICKVKLDPFKGLVKMQIRAIKLSEYGFEILSNSKKFNNCKSKEYKIFKDRVDDALTIESINDCKIIMNYSQMSAEEKFRYCFKHYGDEMKMEINLLSNNNSAMYNKMSDCFYKDPFFKERLSAKYLRNLVGLKKAAKSSCVQTAEVDEIDNDDDDAVVDESKKTVKPMISNKTKINKIAFTQLKETVKKPIQKKGDKNKKKKKVKEIEQIMYHKKKKNNQSVVRGKLFRIKEMNNLQNSHHWRHSIKESMGKKYSKIIAAQGNKNADTFVGFLGFLRDSSYDGNQNVLQVQAEKFFN